MNQTNDMRAEQLVTNFLNGPKRPVWRHPRDAESDFKALLDLINQAITQATAELQRENEELVVKNGIAETDYQRISQKWAVYLSDLESLKSSYKQLKVQLSTAQDQIVVLREEVIDRAKLEYQNLIEVFGYSGASLGSFDDFLAKQYPCVTNTTQQAEAIKREWRKELQDEVDMWREEWRKSQEGNDIIFDTPADLRAFCESLDKLAEEDALQALKDGE